MILTAVVLLFQSVTPPEPGKEVYWIAGLMAGAIGFLFWQLREADKAKTQVHADALKRAHDREDKLLEVDTARTETVRQLVAQVETAAKLTQTVVDNGITLRAGIEANAKAMSECGTLIEGMTLELRSLALRLQDAGKTQTPDKGP